MGTSTTFVTCIEAGALEGQVLLMAESLRAYGGDWASTDIIAIKPRFGPPIPTKTKQAMKRLGIEFVDANVSRELSWWANANKAASMAFLETRVSTPNISWIDGDIVVLKPLDDLTAGPNADYLIRAGEGHLGSNGHDEQAPYWRKLCEEFGLDFDAFPMITALPIQRPIHAYWSTGVYTYAAASGLGAEHRRIIKKMLDLAIGSKPGGLYHQDQVSFSLATQTLGLRHKILSNSMNFNANPLRKDTLVVPVNDIQVFHYHGGLYANHWDWTRGLVEQMTPDQQDMVLKYAPLATGGLVTKLWSRGLKTLRKGKLADFNRRAVSY